MDINYELYKVFYYVAKTLSFSDASKELFISQSAVSQSIKTLEKRLDQTLFIRSTKRVRLTREGEMLFKHIEPAINLISLGENQLLESRSLHGGQLRIGASDTICRYFLVPFFNEFHIQYPNIHIKVTNGTSLQCADLLTSGQVDLIIVNSPNSNLNGILHTTPIRSFQDVFIGSKTAFPELMNSACSLYQLQTYPLLMLDKRSTTSEFLHQLFLHEHLELAPAIELSSNDLLIDLARIGLGIAFVPDFCLDEKKDSDLFIIQTETHLPSRKLLAAYQEESALPAAARHFLALLSESH